MPAWIAVDHGTRRIGIAIGNTEDGIACPLEVIPEEKALERIRQLAREYDPAGIVVGWPVNMDDTEGEQARLAREFACSLAETLGIDVRIWDERLSSFQADEYTSGRMTPRRKLACRDAMAASVILEDFLAGGGPQKAPGPKEKPA